MQKPEPFVSADTVFSVTDAAAVLKGVVETAFPRIRVRGCGNRDGCPLPQAWAGSR